MLKIRLRRMGARNNPFYRVVVSDSRNTPTAASIEEIGYYDVTKNPAQVNIDTARAEHWINLGAQVSPTVKRLLHQVATVSKVAKSA
jgi:small subunit ribosomal protein S16